MSSCNFGDEFQDHLRAEVLMSIDTIATTNYYNTTGTNTKATTQATTNTKATTNAKATNILVENGNSHVLPGIKMRSSFNTSNRKYLPQQIPVNKYHWYLLW